MFAYELHIKRLKFGTSNYLLSKDIVHFANSRMKYIAQYCDKKKEKLPFLFHIPELEISRIKAIIIHTYFVHFIYSCNTKSQKYLQIFLHTLLPSTYNLFLKCKYVTFYAVSVLL